MGLDSFVSRDREAARPRPGAAPDLQLLEKNSPRGAVHAGRAAKAAASDAERRRRSSRIVPASLAWRRARLAKVTAGRWRSAVSGQGSHLQSNPSQIHAASTTRPACLKGRSLAWKACGNAWCAHKCHGASALPLVAVEGANDAEPRSWHMANAAPVGLMTRAAGRHHAAPRWSPVVRSPPCSSTGIHSHACRQSPVAEEHNFWRD